MEVVLQNLAAAVTAWALWIVIGVLYDPIAAPESKSVGAHTPLRAAVTFAYIESLRLWVLASRRISGGDEKSIGELIAGVFVMGSRKYVSRVVLSIRRRI